MKKGKPLSWYSITEAANELGIKAGSVVRAIKSYQIERDEDWLIESSQFEKLKRLHMRGSLTDSINDMTASSVAEYLDCDVSNVWYLENNGFLESYKKGRVKLFNREKVKEFAASRANGERFKGVSSLRSVSSKFGIDRKTLRKVIETLKIETVKRNQMVLVNVREIENLVKSGKYQEVVNGYRNG